MDTGGIAMGKSAKKESFSQQIKQQAFHAVSHAHVVIFMIDAIEGEIFIHSSTQINNQREGRRREE